jgi:L-threonine kinase
MAQNRSHTFQPRIGRGSAFGTFGELLQGILPENNLDFLVTLPIDRYSRATFVPDPEQTTVTVSPAYKGKSHRLAQMILEWLRIPYGGTLTIENDLPEGKGFASSSSDLVATARAVPDAFGITLPVAMVERFMSRIEPSDGVMYDANVLFYHRAVQLGAILGSLPPLSIVSVDEGGEVDTIEFNKIRKPFTQADKCEYRRLLNELSRGFAEQDLAAIGRVATGSAMINQKLQPKRTLDEVIGLSNEVGGLGVAIAHSGTVLGVLLSPANPAYNEQLAHLEQRMSASIGNVTIYQARSFQQLSRNLPDTSLAPAEQITLPATYQPLMPQR